jgi:hypothetical protein
MPIAFTLTNKLHGLRSQRLVGTLTFSGSYATGGEVPTGIAKPGTTKNPILVSFHNKGPVDYRFDSATGKVLAYAAGVEVTAGAYPASVTNDVVVANIEYPKFG